MGHAYNQIRSTGAKILWIEVMNDDDEFLLKQFHSTAINSPDFAGFCDADAVRMTGVLLTKCVMMRAMSIVMFAADLVTNNHNAKLTLLGSQWRLLMCLCTGWSLYNILTLLLLSYHCRCTNTD